MAGAAAWAPGFSRPGGASGPVGAAWEAVEIPGAGLGLRASRPVEAGEALLTVPLGACWPAAAAAREALVADGVAGAEEDELSEEAYVALWLCQQLWRGEASPFAGQIAALPLQLDTVLQWSDGELAELRGSCFHGVAVGLREETEAEWEKIRSGLGWEAWLAQHPDLSADRFRWAKAAVLSRQLELELDDAEAVGTKVVIPVFDLLNHDASGEPNCGFQVEAEGEPSVVVRCARAIGAGEELRISYGPLPNASLLITHGFVTRDNPFDCVELVLRHAVPPARRPWLSCLEAAAATTAAESGLTPFEVVIHGGDDADPAFEFAMRHDLTRAAPLPPTLLAAVRLQVLQESELSALAAREGCVEAAAARGLCAAPGRLEVASEQAAVDRLAAILRALLEGHPTSLRADAELLRSTDAPQRRRMAAVVRSAEKQILATSLAALHGSTSRA